VHELSIVEALLDQVEQEVKSSGQPGRVTALDLTIGRLSGVSTESLRFAFQLLAPGTLAEAAELRITEPRAACRCRACGAQTPVDELVVRCPRCGSGDVLLDGGRDLRIESIELDD
jgi:hydrogenase nickel incorporation protein HypA/HybF